MEASVKPIGYTWSYLAAKNRILISLMRFDPSLEEVGGSNRIALPNVPVTFTAFLATEVECLFLMTRKDKLYSASCALAVLMLSETLLSVAGRCGEACACCSYCLRH
jgi:hypothetical protein